MTLTTWLEAMPPTIREKLAEWDLLDARWVAISKPLEEHLGDFEQALLDKGNTHGHAKQTANRVKKLFKACDFRFWSDISPSTVMSQLAKMHDGKKKIGTQTFNYYITSAKSFCSWMVQDRRASESPLAHLKGINARTDRRHERRALTLDELQRLINAASSGPERYEMAGKDRALLYRLAVETGLRAGELRSLTRASFDFEGEPPTVTVAAAYSKHRRDDTLPLRTGTAQLVQEHLKHKAPAANAFSMPRAERVAEMIRADLDAARKKWQDEVKVPKQRKEREKSAFLAYRDHSNRVADFHALRHTFITNLARAGVHPKTAQDLARHSTITLTMDRYAHRTATRTRFAVSSPRRSPRCLN